MEKVKVTLIRDFVMPGKTLSKGTELEITADRVQNFIDTGLIAGKKRKRKRPIK